MNEEFELEKRIQKADPAIGIPDLNERVVAQAPLAKKPPRFLSYKSIRLGAAALSVGALALVGVVSLPTLMAPQPLFSLAQGGQASSMTAAAPSSEGKIASDAIWPGWVEYNYVADGLSVDGGRGHVYQAQLVGDPEELLTKLASIFDVQGSPSKDEWSTPEYPSYSISGDNFSLSVYWSGTGNWSYSKWDPTLWACDGVASDSTSSSSDAETNPEPSCRTPEPNPELIPTEAEMKSQLSSILAQLGMEQLDTSLMTSYRDEWGSSLNVPYVINGMELPVSFYIGWDMTGALSYVSGSSFELVDRGEFETISPTKTVERIADWRWSGSAPQSLYESAGSPILYSRDAASTDVAVSPIEEGASTAPSAGDELTAPDDTTATLDEPMPMQTEPEIVDLRVNKATETMLGVWDANGGFWLVPGFALYNEQGWFSPIISLIEGVIALPEPMDYGVPMTEDFPATKQD